MSSKHLLHIVRIIINNPFLFEKYEDRIPPGDDNEDYMPTVESREECISLIDRYFTKGKIEG